MAGETAEDDDNDQDLEAGFTTEAAPPTKTEAAPKEEPKPAPEVEDKPQQAEGKKTEGDKPKADEPKTDAGAPKYRQITEEEYSSLVSSAAKTEEFGRKLDTALGNFGNIKDVVNRLQRATPSGVQVDASKAFTKLESEFPELAALLRDDFAEMMKGVKGTGGETPTPSQSFSKEDFEKGLQAARLKDAVEALEDEFPTWRKIVGEVDKDHKPIDPKNPFRVWLGKKSAEYQDKINSTNNPYVISRAIRLFHKEAAKSGTAKPSTDTKPAKPSPKQEARTTRISAAVTPKSAGGSSPSRNSSDDDFEAGFASERAG